MKKKNNLFKNIFYIFFAFCFLGAGIFTLNQKIDGNAYAEDTSYNEGISNNLPPYFSVKDLLGKRDSNEKFENPSSLISADTFLYYVDGANSTELNLSLATNGAEVNPEAAATNPIYANVFYPDANNTSLFQFYNVGAISLYYNGNNVNLDDKNFVKDLGGQTFTNNNTPLQGFEMTFKANGTAQNEINLLDENGKVKEGVYTLTITITLVTCTDGNSNMNEEKFSDENVDITYSFYVADREAYFLNNRPNIARNQFDHEVSVSDATSPNYAYYLYYNYSSEGSNSSSSNKLPYLEFDYTRFELAIEKELSNITSRQSILFDKDTEDIVNSGEQIVYTISDKTSKKCKVFFNDVGNYTVKFNDIQVIEFSDSNGRTTLHKNNLDAISNITKKFLVYVYGYQTNYTDADAPLNENGSRPTAELKKYDYENSNFYESADITSEFLNSNPNYSQTPENSGTTFVIGNITNFIGDREAIRTNQTPVKLSANATLSASMSSFIYSTEKISADYKLTSATLNGKRLYWTNFNGRTESSAGTYIYIIAYTFNNYYSTETSLSANRVFYQVFYFEVSKDLPSISLKTEKLNEKDEIQEVFSDTFVNRNVKITDLTKEDPYNKDVTIRIYARDFNNSYLSAFGGTNGIEFNSLTSTGDDKFRILETNAHYTIRLFFTNEMNSSNISINSNSGYFREQHFTIDKTPVSNIKASNVSSITNSTNFTVVSTVNGFSTNQNIAISWDEKASGASTYAYYRYFSLKNAQYYSKTSETSVSNTLERMLHMSDEDSYLPVNALLDMSTDSNIWLKYKGNSDSFIKAGTISSEYVFTEAGLYLVDVYDAAGNHSVEVYIIDYTTPIFAIFEDSYKIVTSSVYISKASTLYWSKYKAIYVNNFNSEDIFLDFTPDTISENNLTDKLFNTWNNKTSVDIYNAIYNKLVKQNYMRYLTCRMDTTGSELESYTGMYLTVPVNQLSYYINENDEYATQSGVFSKVFDMTNELTYTVLIRDASNTKGLNADLISQYKDFYSSAQTIIISFDDSEFLISYENNKNENIALTSNNIEISDFVDENGNVDETRQVKTTYLTPTRLNKEFVLTFYPTKTDGDITIQVGEVTIKYYPYRENIKSIPVEWDGEGNVTKNIYYHYYELSDSFTTTQIYEYTGDNSSTAQRKESIRLNSENFTTAGRYEISRTYYVDPSDTTKEYYNKNDFYKRTFVFTVDRNEVVTNPSLVTDDNGNHLESLVGGDVFVAMYDNKINADLVVTFPNSPEGSTNGSSLYNNSNPRTILTTNMLPVSIYIPQYKYTTHSQMIKTENGYDYTVDYDFTEEKVTNPDGTESSVWKDTMNNFKEDRLIKEYALYAEIYKDTTVEAINAGADDAKNKLVGKTARNNTGELSSVVANENGFLNFYRNNGTKLDYLAEAGIYHVRILQGKFGTGIGDNNYSQALIFCFEIKASSPDFEVQSTTGDTLNSEMISSNKNYFENQPTSIANYLTNQPIVNLKWEAGSDYIADIDIEEIKLYSSKRSTPYTTEDDIWAQEPTLTNNIYTASLNLELLNIYENNAYVDIVMQYKNHDSRFYTKVVKRITVDLSAPSTNIQNLVANSTSGNLISSLNNASLRIYKTALGATTTNLNNTSYNTSNNTGNFAYYSYAVTADYANTLKNSIDYKTYIGKFVNANGECTKYNNNYEQEISPDNFHASNFTDISDSRYFTGFDAGSYYQVIETDMAGNMSIYTIYIVDYSETTTEEQNRLITYYDENKTLKNYSISDYNEAKNANATNNIYTKTSSVLQNLNYFGDVWAQFQLETYSVTGVKTVRNLMLTPWDKGYAYAFVGDNAIRLSISDLIDSSLSMRYKNAFNFYNRENKKMDSFYFNVRNVSLPASLTDSQNREYIRFNQPSDEQLNSTLAPQTFVTSLKISANDEIIFDATNRLGLVELWKQKQNANITITADAIFGYLTFEINSSLGFTPNTRIVYEYKDNYGTAYKEIHLYKETIIQTEISSENDLYAYYNTNGKLYYITKDGFEYFYNPSKYEVFVYDIVDGKQLTTCNNANVTKVPNPDGITTLTIKTNRTSSYEDNFALEVRDFNDLTNLVKTIYVVLYNELPRPNTSTGTSAAGENNKPGEFKLLDASRNNVTSAIINNKNDTDTGYFSEITLLYAHKTTFLPVKFSVSTDKKTWTEISSGTVLKNNTPEMMTYYLKIWYAENYMENELSNSQYLFEFVPESQIYQFNLSSLTSTFWVEKTINNVTTVVEKSNTIYTVKDPAGKVVAQYSNHYIVNVDYFTNSDAVQIKTNKEQKIVPTRVQTYEKAGIVSELWMISNATSGDLGNIPAFSTNIVISYIPASENFVEEFFTYSNTNGIINSAENSENLISTTSKKFVVSEDYQQLDKIELKWTKYYGIEQNEILIKLVKDGVSLDPTIYSKIENGKSYNYINLKHSGKYIISLYDMSGNVQKFHYGYTGQTENLTFIFLKDVPFTVISTDPSTGKEVKGLPIKQAVYNNSVTFSIDKATRSEFYSTGGYPSITVIKNGVELSSEDISQKNIIKDEDGFIYYTFAEAGYYEIYFTATSDDSNIGKIRKEVYQFTVLSPNEYKYSYILNKYSNYYIERVEKDGKDITETLLKTLDVTTITVGNKLYLAELPLSYLDEKTGAGKYLITVNSNDNSFKNSAIPTSWTFEVTIQVGVAPVKISIPEGKGTTKAVTVKFNQTNIFAEMGECTVRILRYDNKGKYQELYYSNKITSESEGETTATIEKGKSGIFYMQIVSPSGNLLYSYKIVKNEPMNPATIIIIVVAAVLLLIIIFIIIKLRKRISVK